MNTMKKTILNNIKLIAFGIVFAVGASYAYASIGSPSMPASFSASNNTEIPVNIGNIRQDKGGATGGALGGLSVNNLLAYQTSLLQKKAYFKGTVHGGHLGDLTSIVSFGVNYVTPADDYRVGITTTGSLNVTKALQHLRSSNLVNPTMKQVCATSDGTLTLTCPPLQPQCPVNTQPDGDGGCVPIPCVANVSFNKGGIRWGSVSFAGVGGNTTHPELLITVTLVGTAVPSVTSGGERDVAFIIPANATNISYKPLNPSANCNVGIGCEIEGTYGFDHGYTSSVNPPLLPGGRICTEG